MNILIINHYAGSPQHGMEYRPYYLSREWVRSGHNVTIVASSVSHVRNSNPNVVNSLTEEWIDGIKYLWLKTSNYRRNGVERAVNIVCFVSKLLFMVNSLGSRSKPDIVIASSTYPLDIYPAYRIAKKCNSLLVYEVHDLWPLTPVELGGLSSWNPFVMLMQLAENYAYRKSEKVISMLPNALSHMQEHGMSSNKFYYIPNGIAIDEWDNNSNELKTIHCNLIESLRNEGKFLVGYAGSHGLSNALDQLIEAATNLEDLPISFILVGHGPEKERLQEKVRQLHLTSVHFLPSVEKRLIPEIIKSMDVLYLGWKKNPLYRFGICPNKLMDYMMAAKPVIHAVDAVNDLVAECKCGISVPAEDSVAIAGAIRKLFSMKPEELDSFGKRGNEYVTANHDYSVLARRFLAFVLDSCDERS